MNKRIRSSRLALGKRQAEMAAYVGVSRATVSDWESGKIKEISSAKIFRLADFLKVKPRWLVTGEGARTKKGRDG